MTNPGRPPGTVNHRPPSTPSCHTCSRPASPPSLRDAEPPWRRFGFPRPAPQERAFTPAPKDRAPCPKARLTAGYALAFRVSGVMLLAGAVLMFLWLPRRISRR
ncbi:hypothetical protein CW362_14180 [Streptomyces populi]|uniref:Uncharacterized protein n=1 Tax=Streptomyces populi TaxID=2058924 RepID=A0A2I0SR55_9ACTN|nr:hypothetical protein CW362_14180 [Streptomyces populi]